MNVYDDVNPFIWRSPYVKPVDDSDITPVIPSELDGVKVCRWRETKGKWSHLPQASLNARDPPSDVRFITWCMDEEQRRARYKVRVAQQASAGSHSRPPAGTHGRPPATNPHKRGNTTFGRPPPCVICLQEVSGAALERVLVNHPWVRAYFCVLPHERKKWPEEAKFGNVTLVSRDVPVEAAAVLRFGRSAMGRSALITHIWLRGARVREGATERRTLRVAVINTQLEGEQPAGRDYRSKQLELLSQFLRVEGVNGGVIAGNMYPEGANDHKQPERDLKLKDAWKRGNDDPAGATVFDKYGLPPTRHSKILFQPRRGLKVDEPKQFGINVKCEDGSLCSEHCGLISTMHMLK
ncbi:uncharacterized protein SCHCODRAFT_02668122 [Schizophyllum commune H4-8]|uniref:Endonuclease/exonuclease/phosphatase domain-containing protein n=1 Tax=Schizophyllum commune (strain H4-8 / FGSC 9210) TaxID=578458 RepID=D8Q497_SCHCM|nr:uncharacterized protein SCHCODRAFT_02668122 [Schizophyllum commune H4-8]KAI5892709.1 hypothetical protein SCHCODRAFT_02668122 [Schizophyllum commune H4-8]